MKRLLLPFFSIFFFINAFFSFSYADSSLSQKAKEHIEHLGTKGLKTFRDAENHKETFINLYKKYFDEKTITRSVFIYFRQLNDSQKERFSKAFRILQSNTYAYQFRQYPDASIDILNVTSQGKNRFDVLSRLKGTGFKDVDVTWRVHFKDTKPLIFDVIIEGVSMTITKRSEFISLLSQLGENRELFVQKLEEKAGKQ
jgi:phospholipid transport system substrate-binding protein